MRKLLNTLYVTTPESYLFKDGENVVVRIKEEEAFRIPVHNIEGIVTFGYMGVSPGLLQLCFRNNVRLSFLSPHGTFIGRIAGDTKGNVLLRRTQYRLADDSAKALQLSCIFIAGKIANCRSVIERFKRDNGKDREEKNIQTVSALLKQCRNKAMKAHDMNTLRGIEGEAANLYFSLFDNMILTRKDQFVFKGRNRRPPKDKVNALLSFIYTILAHEVQSALETVGLDPYVGFMHADRPGRASLALDMIEELRAYMADRFVLSLINRKQLNGSGFIEHGNSGVVMDQDTKKAVLQAWHKRKQEKIIHPFLKESIPVGLLPYVQAMLMSRYLRGDLDNYPVFLIQ